MNALEHLKMSNEYYEKKERLQKMDCERYQNLSEKKKRQYARKLQNEDEKNLKSIRLSQAI